MQITTGRLELGSYRTLSSHPARKLGEYDLNSRLVLGTLIVLVCGSSSGDAHSRSRFHVHLPSSLLHAALSLVFLLLFLCCVVVGLPVVNKKEDPHTSTIKVPKTGLFFNFC